MTKTTRTHRCAADYGSHVLFADGHVTHYTPGDFEIEAGPFLDVLIY